MGSTVCRPVHRPHRPDRVRPVRGHGRRRLRLGVRRNGQTKPMSVEAPSVDGQDELLRNETPLERYDRNLVELLQEVRVVQTGVQVLFAFLLTAALAPRFPQLTDFQRMTYFVTLLAAGGAAILLIAPTAYHRILFRLGDKEHLVTVANRFTLAGLTAVGVCMTGAVLLVTDLLFDDVAVVAATAGLAGLGCVSMWCLAPLLRRSRIRRDRGPASRPRGLSPD
jgi:hypothetical protein